MNKQHSIRFAARPLSAAVLMALATPAAFAAVTATQLPGVGYVVSGSSVTSGIAGNTLTVNNASNTTPIIIQWGGTAPAATAAATINGTGTAGFNIGQSATTVFSAGASAPILNVDATGNQSQILGTLTVTGAGSASSPLYVANANGIVVGAGSVITTPGGLGLVNADLTSSNAQAVFTADSAVPLSFQGATGGVTVSGGADLAGVGTFLLVAGAGNVNVAGAFVSNGGVTSYGIPGATALPVTIDAGVGGYFSGTTFTAQDKGAAQTFGSLSATNYNNPLSFVYQDAANSTVNLNLGTTSSPYDAATLKVLADGNINLASGGDLTQVTNYSTFNWSGMLTNNGVMDYGDQTGTTLITTTATADISANGAIYANTTTAQHGGFDNATSGLVNAGEIYAYGTSFSNAGTLQMGDNGTHPYLDVYATKGNINLGGTVDVVGAASYTGPTALGDLYLNAVSTAGQSVTVNTTPLNMGTAGASRYAEIDATNVTVDSSLTVSGSGNFYFNPYSAATPVSGAFTVASGATLTANNVYLGGGTIVTPNPEHAQNAYTSYTVNGGIVASAQTNPTVRIGGQNFYKVTSSATKLVPNGTNAVYNISGAGSITAGQLTIDPLLGSVNNITSGQILANGFQLNAAGGSTGTMGISVSAVGSAPQGFNVKVNGNAVLDSGSTVAVQTQAPAGNYTYAQYLMPANANSNLVVQASGNLTVNAGGLTSYGNGSLNGSFFQWPGLVYLQANGGQLTSTTAIANAYAAQASTGHAGVFLIASNITDNSPIYTNGNAGVVFAAPYSASAGIYPYAQTINGVNPALANPGLPTVYFAQANPTVGNANYSFQVLSTFTNEKGYQQENQTFLTH